MLANIFDWLIKNKEWLFSGIGISVIAVLFAHGKQIYNRFVFSHKHKSSIFKEYYLVFYETVFNKLDVKNYATWTYYMALDGYLLLSNSQYENLHEVKDMLRRSVSHVGYQRLDGLNRNMAQIIEDLIYVLDSHLELRADGAMTLKRFYKNPFPNPNYDDDLRRYNQICYLIADLALELTRVSNLILDIIRDKEPGFLVEVGTLSILHTRFKSFKYRKDEISDSPYPGLQHFLVTRGSRDAFMDKSTDLDLNNL